MSKKISISIPVPCHEDWNKMTDVAKGKFCGSCQKEVIDFSGMSQSQLVAFFKKPAGSVCGRFRNDQLDAEMTIPAKRVPWAKYFFQIALPAFLFSAKSNAQGKVSIGDTMVVVKPTDTERLLKATMGKVSPVQRESLVSGKVTDADGNSIPFATVMIKNTRQGVSCDETGTFSITTRNSFPLILVVSSVGFKTVEYETDSASNMITLEKVEMKEVVIVGYQRRTCTFIAGGVSIVKREKLIDTVVKKIDTVFSKFTVYPNPALSTSNVYADLKKLGKGNYHFSISNMLGQELKKEKIELDGYIRRKEIDISGLIPGVYVVKFQNEKTNKIYSQKLIIK